VCDDEYARFCPQGKGSRVDPNYQGGASGHVFVEVRINGKWKLINTTYAPYSDRKGDHATELQMAYQKRSAVHSKETADQYRANMLKSIRTLDFSDLEITDFPSPEEIEKQLKAGKSVQVPEYESLPETLPAGSDVIHFRKMMIYDVSPLSQIPLHKWKDRVNLIASGRKDSDKCRFSVSGNSPAPETPQANLSVQ